MPRILFIVGLLLSAIATSGCAAFRCHDTSVEYAGAIDSQYRVALIRHMEMDVFGDESKNFADSTLEIYDETVCVSQHRLANRTGKWTSPPNFKFGQLQGRRNETGERVWIVDATSKTTVASLDRASGDTTGLGAAMPTWATIDGGEPIPESDKTNLPRPAFCPID